MEPYVAYLLAVLLGGSLSMIVPYLLKVKADPGVKFDVTYFYGLCISTILSVVALIPDTNIVDVRSIFTVFFAALGLNQTANKLNKTLKG